MSRKNKRTEVVMTRRTAEHQRFVQGMRGSSAASPHRAGSDYRRKPKHTGKGWE